ncbi:hypothetical protein F4779DRAFT_630263 [Xylariaceae sp. FL0662B]|nr:hypothetical protein F4779DRAFT_630263 [Xylariaceae sp. FL0662B]
MAFDEAHKARMMAHMNADHTFELKQYLRAFNGLSAFAARGAQLTDMAPDALTIRSASGTHTVVLAPPLASAADARVRLVDMARTAQQRLGVSEIQIAAFAPPRGAGIASFAGVALYFVCAATLALVQPGSAAWGLLDAAFPFGAAGYRWLVKAIFVPVLAIHVTEAWWMSRTRLQKHGIDFGSALWLLWVADTFFEGLPAMMRFDGLVEAEKRKREGTKH